MYFDNKPCEVCGSEVELRPRETARVNEADATVDERVCSNATCASHEDGGPTA